MTANNFEVKRYNQRGHNSPPYSMSDEHVLYVKEPGVVSGTPRSEAVDTARWIDYQRFWKHTKIIDSFFEGVTKRQCANYCNQHSLCVAFEYNSVDKKCQLTDTKIAEIDPKTKQERECVEGFERFVALELDWNQRYECQPRKTSLTG